MKKSKNTQVDLSKEEIQRRVEEEILAQEEKQRLLRTYLETHPDRKALTRRSLLEAGVISFGASMTLPIAAWLKPETLWAAEGDCPGNDPAAAGPALAPFVSISLAGGAMLASNYVALDQGGNLLPTYDKMGLGNNQFAVVRAFNNVAFPGNGISKFLAGVQAQAAAGTLAKTAFVAIPNRSGDDTGNNQIDASGMVAKAGLVGANLPSLGSTDKVTGTNNEPARVRPPNPLRVRSINDINAALSGGATGPLATLNNQQKITLSRLIKNLSEEQVQRVVNDSGGRMLASLVNCANEKNYTVAQTPKPSLDARQNTTTAPIWGINAQTAANAQNAIFGSMVISGLTGAAGTVALNMGGYDYHNNTRTTGDDRDRAAGELVGRILQTAAVLNRKVFINITSDGSCTSPVSQDRAAPWASDRGSAGVIFVLAYDPAGRPPTTKSQIGHFTAAQAVDDKFITGNSPQMAASAVFANYLRFSGQMALLDKVIPGVFSAAQLNDVLAFG